MKIKRPLQGRLNPADYNDNRRRKAEEQNKIRHGNDSNGERWQKVLSKKEAARERRFQMREERLRNSTSFFISNLPENCSTYRLWHAFQHLNNLEDVFVPAKKDRAGNRFGFIRLSGVKDVEEWIERLKEVEIDGAIIGVNLLVQVPHTTLSNSRNVCICKRKVAEGKMKAVL
ncbi:putative RNA recognition motif domain, nucleotide-binding alpha-beta plait domain superfamily [Helianthus annuus]|nr:putative RNA recognition motif domain, nucleotide-binding alpha-beta plait domain superfamily [Helianthus annuus]